MDRAPSRRRVQALGKRARAWRSDPEGSLAATADLVRMAQADDEAALGELLKNHRTQVRGVCWRLSVRRMDIDDFVQEGLIAMLTPIRRYDPGRGTPLWFYARPHVRGHIINRLGGRLGLTLHQTKFYMPVLRARDRIREERAGAEVGVPEIKEALERLGAVPVSARSIEAVLHAEQTHSVPFDEQRDSKARRDAG